MINITLKESQLNHKKNTPGEREGGREREEREI